MPMLPHFDLCGVFFHRIPKCTSPFMRLSSSVVPHGEVTCVVSSLTVPAHQQVCWRSGVREECVTMFCMCAIYYEASPQFSVY